MSAENEERSQFEGQAAAEWLTRKGEDLFRAAVEERVGAAAIVVVGIVPTDYGAVAVFEGTSSSPALDGALRVEIAAALGRTIERLKKGEPT